MIHSYQVGSYTGSNHNDDLEEELYKTAGSDASADEFRGLTEKTKKQQADVLKEEEKYDHLLNSIQAQTLIRTVDKVNLGGAVNNTQDNLEEVDTAGFTGSEVGSFVKSQCDIMEEASRYIENAKVEYDQMKAFEGANFIYAKNWAAYTGDNYGQILSKDREWTVSDRQMAVTNNAFFMHCLPVRRNMIVTDDVIESPQSIVIPEAANREISATVVLKRLIEGLE